MTGYKIVFGRKKASLFLNLELIKDAYNEPAIKLTYVNTKSNKTIIKIINPLQALNILLILKDSKSTTVEFYGKSKGRVAKFVWKFTTAELKLFLYLLKLLVKRLEAAIVNNEGEFYGTLVQKVSEENSQNEENSQDPENANESEESSDEIFEDSKDDNDDELNIKIE